MAASAADLDDGKAYTVSPADVEDRDKEDLESKSDDGSVVKVLDYMSKEANDTYDPAHFDPTLYDQPPDWKTQFSYRSALCVVVLGFVLSFINLRGNLIVGTGPPTTVPSGMLTYLFIKVFSIVASKIGISQTPFSRQENTVVQTAIVAAVAMTWGGGFSGQLFALTNTTYNNLGGASMPGNRIQDTLNLNVKNVAPLMPVIAFAGPFMLISLRKLIVIDMDLAWPSGTAVGVLMNSFHSGKTSAAAARQVRSMLEWFVATFLWSFTRWFFSGYNGLCGYEKTPLFGLKAKYYGWYYEFMTMYVGAGMIAPRIVSASMMLGAIIAYGILWPIVMGKAGQWYPLKTVGTSSFSGLYGYQVCCGIALMLGDCLFNLSKVSYISAIKYKEVRAARAASAGANRSLDPSDLDFVDTHVESKYSMNTIRETPLQRRLRQYYFYRDNIPGWLGAVSYVALTAFTAVLIPLVYPQVKWYWIPVSMALAVPLSVANAYSTGLTDYNLGATYAKVAIIAFASIVGLEKGGVVVGLFLSILIKATSNNAVEMCQDFRTGYLTMSSAKSMVAAQLFGAFVGMFTAPLCYFIFADAFALGLPGSLYAVPYGAIYRNIAVVGVDGFGVLPMYCLWMSFACFVAAILIDIMRELLPPKYKRFVPYPVAMSLTFYLGTYLAMDYSVGAIARFLWGLKDPASEALLMPAVATGLIIGDGMGAFPGAILGLFKIQPPMCLNFVPSFHKNSAFPSGY